MITLAAFMGLAVDTGYAYLQKTRLQSLADATALACVIDPKNNCTSGGAVNSLTGYPFKSLSLTTPGKPDANANCPLATQVNCSKAEYKASWITFFFPTPNTDITATAVAGSYSIPACLSVTTSLTTNGGFVAGTNCSVDIGQSTSNSILKANGQGGVCLTGVTNGPGGSVCSTTITNSNAQTNVYGSIASSGASYPTPTVSFASVPSKPDYPFPANLPTYANISSAGITSESCTKSGSVWSCSALTTYKPGIYNYQVRLKTDNSTPHGAISFMSGTYVFNGDGGNPNGFALDTEGVTLTNQPGGVALYINGNRKLGLSGIIDLQAFPCTPTSTAGSALLITHPMASSATAHSVDFRSKDVFSGVGVFDLRGDNVTVSGGSNFNVQGTILTNSLTINGQPPTNNFTQSCDYINTKTRIKLLN